MYLTKLFLKLDLVTAMHPQQCPVATQTKIWKCMESVSMIFLSYSMPNAKACPHLSENKQPGYQSIQA